MTESLNLTTVPIRVEAGGDYQTITVDLDPDTGHLRLVQGDWEAGVAELINLTEEHAQGLIGAIAAMAPRRPGKPPMREDYEVAVASGTAYGPIEVAVRRHGFDTTVLLRQEGDEDAEAETQELDTLVIDAGKFDLLIEVLTDFRDEVLR